MNTSTERLFSTVQPSDPLHFWRGGHLQYKEVSEFLRFDTDELSKIAGVSKSSVRLDERIPTELRERLSQIANICNHVAEYFRGDPERTSLWFTTSNPQLGGISPRDMIRYGRYARLLKFILAAKEQNEITRRQTRLQLEQ